jgi:hypothetical protein
MLGILDLGQQALRPAIEIRGLVRDRLGTLELARVLLHQHDVGEVPIWAMSLEGCAADALLLGKGWGGSGRQAGD